MDLHEYQAKEILKDYGIPIPPFGVASNVGEVEKIIKELKLGSAVVKIQVHAGGRGKSGGVKIGKNRQEILAYAKALIGMKLVNNQTGPGGVVAEKVIISALVDIAKEYYLGAIIDRKNARAVLIASPEGGMDIEEVAAKHPEKILKLPIQQNGEVKIFHLWRLCNFMGWAAEQREMGMQIAKGVAKAFMDSDGSLLEINPLIKDRLGNLLALDAKLSIDDNALYRHEKIASYYDPTQQLATEVAAKKHDLAYIALDGNIGCMVNGAGLAMATMDIIKYYGGKPANFLDVGGGASKEKVSEGFKIILSDPKVKAILVNIFGGIMNCATLAEGIIHAVRESSITVPLIVRMEGTNVDEGKKLLKNSKLPIITAEGLSDAAEKAVRSLKK